MSADEFEQKQMDNLNQPRPEFAFFYAAPLESNVLKSLLLFFDGIAIVASEQRIAQAINAEPWFFLPILQSELSRFWTPDDFFDNEYRRMHEAEVRNFLDSGLFDNRQPNLTLDNYMFPSQLPFLPPNQALQDEVARFRENLLGLSMNVRSMEAQDSDLLKTLMQRGLVEMRRHVGGLGSGQPQQFIKTEVGNSGSLPFNLSSVPAWAQAMSEATNAQQTVLAVDSVLRQVNEALVSQFARTRCAQRFGLIIHPTNANERSLERLVDSWGVSQQVTFARLVLHDLEVVGPGLDDVSIEDLLSFRERYGAEHREYMRELRRFFTEISPLTDEEQVNELYYRRQELAKRAHSLSQISRSVWKSSARFLLGITGAALTLAAGNVPGAAVSTGATLLSLGGGQAKVDAYTYLYHVAKL